MEESRKVSKEWLKSNLWEPNSREMMEEGEELEEEEEDLDEYEGVVQALSNLESTTRVRAFQSTKMTALDIHLRSSSTSLNPVKQSRFQAESKIRRASDHRHDAGSFVSSASSSSWEEESSARASPLPRWSKVSSEHEVLAELEVGTSGRLDRVHGKVLDSFRNDKQLQEKNRRKSSASNAAAAEHENHHHGFKRISTSATELEEEADLWQRMEDLEKKVNMLITEELYFHRISVPRGCFAVVLPGPNYAHRFTEDVIESLQMRIESIWPLCYLSPVVAKLASFASAMFRWLPLPTSTVYTCCNFTSSSSNHQPLHPAVDCQQTSSAYVTKRLMPGI